MPATCSRFTVAAPSVRRSGCSGVSDFAPRVTSFNVACVLPALAREQAVAILAKHLRAGRVRAFELRVAIEERDRLPAGREHLRVKRRREFAARLAEREPQVRAMHEMRHRRGRRRRGLGLALPGFPERPQFRIRNGDERAIEFRRVRRRRGGRGEGEAAERGGEEEAGDRIHVRDPEDRA